MKKFFSLLFFLMLQGIAYAQSSGDSLKKAEGNAAADDPSQFFTRVELFNDFQHYKGYDINQTTLRTIIKIGKRFTTRLDVPFLYNSLPTAAGYRNTGIGDISFRLLGYKILENPKSAFTVSIEVSMNTAQSPILGTGKNLIIPVFTYSRLIPKGKIILAFIAQQANSVSGYKSRSTVSFTKFQAIMLKPLSRRSWTVFAPTFYIDYVRGGVSMNMEGRYVYAPTRRMNIWLQGGAGIFGDFIARYQWAAQVGVRYFLLRSMNFQTKPKG